MTRDGVLVITAQRHRTQARNRQDALERLVELDPPRGGRAATAPPDPTDRRGAQSAASKPRNTAPGSSGCGSEKPALD